jgi:hypothetical protein
MILVCNSLFVVIESLAMPSDLVPVDLKTPACPSFRQVLRASAALWVCDSHFLAAVARAMGSGLLRRGAAEAIRGRGSPERAERCCRR